MLKVRFNLHTRFGIVEMQGATGISPLEVQPGLGQSRVTFPDQLIQQAQSQFEQ